MPEVDAASPAIPSAVEHTGAADVVVGVLSYNNADTIGHVIRAAREGLSESFPEIRSLIVHADGGSRDGTLAEARAAAGDSEELLQVAYPMHPAQRMIADYPGVPGKGYALRTVFEAADQAGARACAVIQSDVRSITPAWTSALVRPVLEAGADYVAPVHRRHRYEATVLSGIVYPLMRALYGKRVREPIGAEFGFSANMVRHYLQQARPESETGATGNDMWLATEAMTNGFQVAEARLGPRSAAPRDPPPELSGMLALVLGALFGEVERTSAAWQRTRGSETVQAFGTASESAAEPAAVDVSPMIDSFRLGYQNLQEIWKLALPPATLVELKRLASRPPDAFRMADPVWARIVYDFLLAYRLRVMDRDHLLRALTPLYLGWLSSYALEVREAGMEEVEQRIETLCVAYEAQKAYLISRWRWPDRFNP